MSTQYPGGIISKTAPVPAGPFSNSAAPGIWTLNQQAAYAKQGIWPTAGNVNPDSFIENLFSTYLYTGNGTTQTITNGIDLSTKGGLVWLKNRSAQDFGNTRAHWLFDSARTAGNSLASNNTNAESTAFAGSIPFSTTGFSINTGDANLNGTGTNPYTYVSWTFREQPKFFDIVTYTGNGVNGRTIAHNLGSTPGCIMVKCTSAGQAWRVYHRSLTANYNLELDATDGQFSDGGVASPTSTTFTVNDYGSANTNTNTYVAYLFAHDAGGFGLTGTDNVISCGSFTTDGSGNATVSLGYEPQWLMIKASTASQSWYIEDNMRAFNLTSRAILFPNLTNAEATGATAYLAPNSTGFAAVNGQLNASTTYIYVAIRRGPMAVPTDATKVFSPNVPTAFAQFTTGFPVDLGMWNYKPGYAENTVVNDRLRGVSSTNAVTNANNLVTSTTAAEAASQGTQNWNNTGLYAVTSQAVFYSFRRAPSFFDEVCFNVSANPSSINHNLTVAPEFMIVKGRNLVDGWYCYHKDIGATKYILLNSNSTPVTNLGPWSNTAPTSSVFTVGGYFTAYNYVWYGFATCPGVSKVGSYTGTGTTQVINCGFTAGSRFIMIKRTDSTGDWYVWDSARGIIAGNDPYLLFNSAAAEVTSTDYVDTAATGFEISSTAPAGINANGGTYIFLAIA